MAAAVQQRTATNNNNITTHDGEHSKRAETTHNGVNQLNSGRESRQRKRSTVQRMLSNIIEERKKSRGLESSEGEPGIIINFYEFSTVIFMNLRFDFFQYIYILKYLKNVMVNG